ncbi:hypothetical protein IAE51_10325 [Lactococcus sp. S64]|uniref:hypothetical protein n=1 Tax=Lactococcus sp. S64 TaxID=2767459 RepID=UPI001905D4FA|nr:hypothetical protein [Lactococcus sp. S64]MBK0084292.1 hypothetical protein [Lactococcus sp. S64]
MVVENKYRKYRIEDLKRINSRYYQIEMHGKTYVIDYFDGFDFRNYFPFKIFYQGREKRWKIYEVADDRKYGAKRMPWIGKFPGVFEILGLYPICVLVVGSFFRDKRFLEGVALSIIIFSFIFIFLRYIKRKEELDISESASFILMPVENQKVVNTRFIRLKQILVVLLFIFLFVISLREVSYVLFFPAIAVAVGNMWNNKIYVPDETIKYQIIEKEEN